MANYRRHQGNAGRRGSKKEPKVLLSFEYLDIQQGQTLKDWNKKDDLLKLQEKGQTLNRLTVAQALAQKHIIQYDISNKTKWNKSNMPKASKWKYPNTVPTDNIPWSKIELGRKLRVIGYLDLNVGFGHNFGHNEISSQ